MSGGRRTQTFTLNNNDKRRAANSYPALGGAGNFRGLKKSDLAGAIFGCTHQTFKECVTQFIFGAVLGGALYALGGFDGKQYLKSVERFDPREPRWVQLEEMSAKRGGLSAAVLNEKLYAIGGFDGSKFLSSVEVFDPRAGSWLTVDSIASPRAYGAAAVLGDSIYMIGGLGGIDYVDSVESYQDGVGWEVSSQAIGKRSFLTAVVL